MPTLLPVTKKSEPVRTCVGCRQRHPAQVLMRVRLHDNALVNVAAVGGASTGGRGAWLCLRTMESCLKRAMDSHAFDRAFRRRVSGDAVAAFVDGFPTAENS